MRPTIPITKPSLGEAEAEAARQAVLSGWVSQGPQVQEFENEFATYVGAKHACAVSNCTAALHLAMHALQVKTDDEVITVSHSFIATANAIRHCGATPVFVDIDPQTYNLDENLLEAAISPRTRGILPVHQIGLPAHMDKILRIADKHHLPVIEDAACAIGSQVFHDGQWQSIGRPHGKVACFSLHPRKVITTGEGGMITTNDSQLDRQFRLLRQHGMSLSDRYRHSSRQVVFEQYLMTGFNYRMTDIQAAIGRVQLQRLPAQLEKRNEIAQRYTSAIREISGLRPPFVPGNIRPNFQSYAVRVTREFPMSRDELMQKLLDIGISTRRGIMNSHQEPAFDHLENPLLPESELARDEVVLLPLYESLSCEEQDYVIESLIRLSQQKSVAVT